MVSSVLTLSVSLGDIEVTLGLFSLSNLLVYSLFYSVPPQSVLLRSSEVTGDRRIWGWRGTCSLQGPVDGIESWTSLLAGNLSVGCLVKLKQVGKELRVLPSTENLELGE